MIPDLSRICSRRRRSPRGGKIALRQGSAAVAGPIGFGPFWRKTGSRFFRACLASDPVRGERTTRGSIQSISRRERRPGGRAALSFGELVEGELLGDAVANAREIVSLPRPCVSRRQIE